jgi:hypothetical protein
VLHELAHHQRRDILIAAIVSVITALHWFNPLAWLAAARFRAERELACDEAVLAATLPFDRPAYGQTILRLLELLPPHRDRWVGAVGVLSSSRRTIRRRIASLANPSPRRFRVLGPIVLLIVAFATLTGPAQTVPTTTPATSQAATDGRSTVTRSYKITDLLIDIPDFGNSVDSRGWPVAPTSQPATPTRAELVNKLIVEITSTVDPFSWRVNTGTLGAIREEKGEFIITQTPANHEKILEKLQRLRAPRSLQVTLETRYLTGEMVMKAMGDRDAWGAGDARLFKRFLSDDEVAQLIEINRADRKGSMIAAPRITLFSGQRSYVLVSRQSAYVADIKPAGAKFETVVDVIQSGVLLNARAQASADRKQVTLTLNPRLSTLLSFLPKRWPKSPPGRDDLIVQVPIVQETSLDATVTLPVGMSAAYRLQPVNRPTTNPSEPPPDPVVMLVKARVIEVTPEQEAGPSTRPTPPTLDSPK